MGVRGKFQIGVKDPVETARQEKTRQRELLVKQRLREVEARQTAVEEEWYDRFRKDQEEIEVETHEQEAVEDVADLHYRPENVSCVDTIRTENISLVQLWLPCDMGCHLVV